MSDDIIGYVKTGEDTYSVIEQLKKGYIYTAAVITCSHCGTIMSGMGGPRPHAVCFRCADELDITSKVEK